MLHHLVEVGFNGSHSFKGLEELIKLGFVLEHTFEFILSLGSELDLDLGYVRFLDDTLHLVLLSGPSLGELRRLVIELFMNLLDGI